ncbi:MAG: 23S rRNA (guanosine(2251)-2'-O)-methyltransferase RlmB [Actinobacteria bacterium]|nr:23S rRNA (guanosine(2251)-2'-O)-methyltransferase RlmB [Micrococcales bacterium]MCB0902854.1 23S rRNA (guanosine(2251)-2'-O)-methyltransferase RlmB [Actinomycetota bacterium]MCO5300035.1 23S rRNA (guanosine(2251)-2'-O)-methyltransferase RlmB [Candidatus Nanopelagicales bacterium]MCB9429132.1 23S rRNA (guanosine(2251)-2'-O)-methyltransferase RlmB [Actinomycetota bacterium]HPE13181.1 23S rRNA (guanosine(2251)-2'-O)-methyltransferase RlmB [Actinomycetota bacterium]
MAGNSQRRGARRTSGSKKGASVGSGGQRRQGLEGKGPTPAAKDRPGHPAARRSKAKDRAASKPRREGGGGKRPRDVVAGRNPVVEALRAGIPAVELLVQQRTDLDERVQEAVTLADAAGLPIKEVPRSTVDDAAGDVVHQGVVLVTQPFQYSDLNALLGTQNPLWVVLDQVTDPHNLGAIARSAAAFAATALLIPQRRSAPVTPAAWRTSAGALARLPVCQIGNVSQTLQTLQEHGAFCVGLDGEAHHDLGELAKLSDGPLALVVGAEGRGLGSLVAKRCDLLVSIPMTAATESLNASVAAGIALHWVAAHRNRETTAPSR